MDFIFSQAFFVLILRGLGVFAVVASVIIIHELGHYLVARWCGIKSDVFSIGFGPELFHYTDKRNTRWRLGLIPLGGYVRFLGDENIASSASATTHLPQGSFGAAAAWKKSLTVFAGPFFNFLLALILLSFLYYNSGRIIVEPIVGSLKPGMPAIEAGLKKGDRILSIAGRNIHDFNEIKQNIAAHVGERLKFVIQRGDATLPFFIVPQMLVRTDNFGERMHIGVIGITAPIDPLHENRIDTKFIKKENYSLTQSIVKSSQQISYIVQETLHVLGKLFIGEGDRCQLGGPKKIVNIAWQTTSFGLPSALNLIALLSVGIGLINLLPVPPLDGGQLFFYLWETIFGRPVNESLKAKIFTVGLICVLLFMVFTIINDFIAC